MTYQKITNSLLIGVAADTKPTTYASNTLFIETDSGSVYTWNGSSWVVYEGPGKTETLTGKTIDGGSNTITNIVAASLPSTIVYTGQTNTFGAFDQIIPGGNLKLSASSFKTTIAATPTANRTITIPDTTDTLVGLATSDTLTNKTLTSPHIGTIVNGSGTLTLPTSTDTIVGRATTDTLTNKTLTTPIIASITSSSGTLTVNTSGTITIPNATDTLVGRTTTDTLTGKTLVAASNTITDTSAGAGDILKHNGTKFVRLAIGSAGNVLTVNGGATDIAWTAPSGGGYTEGLGVSTPQSGDASTKTFNIAHGLTGTPSWYSAIPASADAADVYYLTIGSTNITVNYSFPPPTGTNNLKWAWRAVQ